jgi:hypothetical protein
MKTIAFVGCGGVFYHGMGLAKTWMVRRGLDDMNVVCIDPDSIEPRNRTRQWPGAKTGMEKAMLGVTELITVAPTGTSYSCVTSEVKLDCWGGVAPRGEVWLVVIPDNHRTRLAWAKYGQELSRKDDVEHVTFVTAGSSLTGGWASSTRWIKGTEVRDWLKPHPDIVLEAKKEEEALDHARQGCGAVVVEGVVQTDLGNQFSAGMLWLLMEQAAAGKFGLMRMEWNMEEMWTDGTINVRLKEVEDVRG